MAGSFLPLESARLNLRRFRESDLEPFHTYRSDPDVGKYQGWSALTLDEARQFIETQDEHMPGALGVGAQIAIELKASGEMVGDVFLNTPADEPDHAQFGYTLGREHQGKGVATEAVETLLDYVFGPLDKHRATALTFADNARSVALLERIGMRREAHHLQSSRLDGAWVDDYVYAMLQSDWLLRRRA